MNVVNKLLPKPVYDSLKRIYLFCIDGLERLSGRRDALMPPRRMMDDIGWGPFQEFGNAFLEQATQLGHLRPTDHVLDVGCGVGRMAIPMTKYLDGGFYEGFDVNRKAVRWCSTHITPLYPNFRFQYVDLYNKRYHPKGTLEASRFVFPYETETYDFVFLTSVFSHMLPMDMMRYVSEIARVLKTGRRCICTLFLMNDTSSECMRSEGSDLNFNQQLKQQDATCWVVNQDSPEEAVAYEESFMRELFRKNNLEIVEPVYYGTWSGRPDGRWYQDVLVAAKV